MLKENRLFITGTDTGVGKSIATAYLALELKNKGKKVAISKPIQTGVLKDTDFLKDLTENKIPIFNTYGFKLPAAPSVASLDENKTIEIEKVSSDIRNLEKEFEVVIVEGIGGIAVPICRIPLKESTNASISARYGMQDTEYNYLVADLIKDLNYPTIVVCRPSLGTINHSVLTIEYAKQKRLNILGFIVSGFNENTSDKAELTAPEEIEKITNCKCIARIPYLKELNHKGLCKAAFANSGIEKQPVF